LTITKKKEIEMKIHPLSRKLALILIVSFIALSFFPLLRGRDNRFFPEQIENFSFKAFVSKTISPQRIDKNLRYLTSEPHVASSPRNDELADFIMNEWKAYGLDEVYKVSYDVLLSYPESISVELISPKKQALSLREEGYEEDPDTLNPRVGIPYNAYSLSGEITAALIYVNGGNPQDYDYLEKIGVELKGKIALVRYSSPYSYRGFKAYTAEKRGLAALLIYSDPKDDGFARGPVFPNGPWGPMSHIQRGGIPYDFLYPGDPLTPGWASKPGCKRTPKVEAASLPKIMSVPLSAQDALILLEVIGGEEAPKEWRGALLVTYRLGGPEARVQMKVKMKDPIAKITNVIGCIKGTDSSEGIVLVGNHRDAWVFGGHDPSSGTACLMELAKSLADAKKAGYQLKRTVYFASWDAEEFTLTGSTEWGEDNREWLKKNLIAYLNVDSAASGKNFNVQAVPSFSHLIIQALREVNDPTSREPVYNSWKKGPQERGTIAIASGSGKVNPIGSGTDHTVFLNHLGVPALDMTFSGDYGVYHSMYDNYYWMSHFGDPGMLYTACLTNIWAVMVIDLACDSILPLDYEEYASELEMYLREWSNQHDPKREKSENLFSLIQEMKKTGSLINPYIFVKNKTEAIDGEKLQKINRLLMEIERDFSSLQGIPKRNWFKHLIFGARYTYDVLLLPALTEAAEAGDGEGITQALRNLEDSLKKVNSKLKMIALLLGVKN
jgi:N-acetylated-alpha-linked acidic dipeptidase